VSWERKSIENIDQVVQLAGADHVGLGSDFDGATMPRMEMERLCRKNSLKSPRAWCAKATMRTMTFAKNPRRHLLGVMTEQNREASARDIARALETS